MQFLTAQTFASGRSFWRVILTNRHAYCELDTVEDFTRGKRPLDWHLDIVATGDTARIAELWLHTPSGSVALKIIHPYSAYIFNAAIMSTSGSSSVAQVIGRVNDRDTGLGTAFIWDVAEQKVYRDDAANVRNFAAWRPGICAPGALAVDAMGVKL